MAEIGLTASVAGLISLGIQVCGGLILYYQTYRGQDEEVSTTLTSVDSLLECLRNLKRRTQSSSLTPQLKYSVERDVNSCVTGIRNLERYLLGINNPRWPRVLNKAMYPFKDKTLRDLRGRVGEIRSNLALTLQDLSLYYAESTFGVVQKIEATTSRANPTKIAPLTRNLQAQARTLPSSEIYDDIVVTFLYHNTATAAAASRPAELDQLENVVRTTYQCDHVYSFGLDVMTTWRFQLQVRTKLGGVLNNHDIPKTLLILHYIGTGRVAAPSMYDGSSVIEPFMLKACSNSTQIQPLRPPPSSDLDEIVRDEVQGFLERSTHPDILMLFDCYHMGSLDSSATTQAIFPPISEEKYASRRKFEFIGSLALEHKTRTSTSSSLTSALAWALEQLPADCPNGFRTYELRDKIMVAPTFPRGRRIPFPMARGPLLLSLDESEDAKPSPQQEAILRQTVLLPCCAFASGVAMSIFAIRVISPSAYQNEDRRPDLATVA